MSSSSVPHRFIRIDIVPNSFSLQWTRLFLKFQKADLKTKKVDHDEAALLPLHGIVSAVPLKDEKLPLVQSPRVTTF
jgi:hypothetical protein